MAEAASTAPTTITSGQVTTAWPPLDASPRFRLMRPLGNLAAITAARRSGGAGRMAGAASGGNSRDAASAAAAAAAARADAVALVDGADIVLGVPIEDSGLVKVVRRVIILAATAATFYTCHFIAELMRGTYNSPSSSNSGSNDSSNSSSSSLWTAISSLLIQLSIPACGYYGALQGNRQLTCCFCSCSLFVTIVSIMSFIRLNIRIGELDGQCHLETNYEQRKSCELWTEEGVAKYIMISSTILAVCLGCLAFWFGNSLYQRLGQFAGGTPRALPLVGEVIDLASVPTILGPAGGGFPIAPASLPPPPRPPPPPPQQELTYVDAASGEAAGSSAPSATPVSGDAPADSLEEQVVPIDWPVASIATSSSDHRQQQLGSGLQEPAVAPAAVSV